MKFQIWTPKLQILAKTLISWLYYLIKHCKLLVYAQYFGTFVQHFGTLVSNLHVPCPIFQIEKHNWELDILTTNLETVLWKVTWNQQ
jgi:hypothetical protein